DLSTGPLIRAGLVRLDEPEVARDHILLVTIHHIVSDAWSTAVLTHELTSFYRARRSGQIARLPALPVQYADFATWQRDWMRNEVLRDHLDFWSAALAELTPLDLPLDRARPAMYRHDGDSLHFEIDAQVASRLRALSQKHAATLFMVLLAGFKIFLQRQASQDDITVGSPIANRNHAEIEGLIGFFVNTLVLRTQIDPSRGTTFGHIIERVKQVTLDAYAHQDMPFEQIVEALAPERDTSRTPLFQVMFTLQNAPAESLQLGETTVTFLQPRDEQARFDMSVTLQERAGILRGVWQYNTSLFERDTIARMVARYQDLLAMLSAEPGRSLVELPVLTADEHERLLEHHNNTRTPYPRGSIHQLFADRAAERPDAVAVVSGAHSLTYGELDRRANALAHRLVTRGITAGDRVGLCAERSPAMIIGMLAILKIGGAYVPLDPDYPRDRLSFMIDDTELIAVIVSGDHEALFDELAPAIRLDEQDEGRTAEGVSWDAPPIHPQHLDVIQRSKWLLLCH
ncbi:MAG: condensation domain-containing protein, partial [Myxococcota bacterium]